MAKVGQISWPNSTETYQYKRWHKVIWLDPKEFPTVLGRVKLADGWSRVDFRLEVKYQPTVEYVMSIIGTDPTMIDIHGRIEKLFKPFVDSKVKGFLKNLKCEDFIPPEARKRFQDSIAEAIVSLFAQSEITCDATCYLDSPVVDWPKEGDEPGPIADQEFLKDLKRQSAKFFEDLKVLDLEAKDRALKLKTTDDDILQKEEKIESDKHDRKAQQESDSRIREAKIRQREDVSLFELEAKTREARMKEHVEECAFLVAEKELFEKERDRALAEAYAKSADALLALELEETEIDNLKIRRLAEKIVEMTQQTELLKALPEVLKCLGQSTQHIANLSVLQLSEGSEQTASLPGSPIAQLMQSLYFLREVAKTIEQPEPKPKAKAAGTA